PSLLHGDLWGGNYMFLQDGRPALYDPAPLYGDREFDICITKVFGGFTSEFYDAYNKHYPLAKGASYRREFYRLYLLMVHLLKFGEMYRVSVAHSMDKILQDTTS
ncbi:fructosamine kinase family protein, partial [Staphylococcus aureus]|nr:fructosamine kinase family protein [Staphylococcus aureus]